jgi:hypothetical protein
MTVRQFLRPTNRKVRLAVGLMLTALFCIQCTGTTEADRTDPEFAVVMNGKTLGKNASSVGQKVDQLAKNDHAALLAYCREAYQNRYSDYTCTLVKQERLAGRLGEPQTIDCKFMENPFSVVLKWVDNPDRADRVIFVKGKYGDQMLARPSKALFRMIVPVAKRKPDGEEAMRSTLRPVNRFGFGNSLKALEEVYRQAEQAGDLKEEFGGYGTPEVTGRKSAILIRHLPPTADYPAAKTITYIDLEYLVPTIVEGYDWDGNLTCRYVFKDIKFNVGLTEDDFLPENNDMEPVR